MDHCLSVLRAFPPDSALEKDEAYNTAIRSHLEALDGLLSKHMGNLVSHAEAILSALHPTRHTTSCITMIETVIKTDPKSLSSRTELLDKILQCLLLFDKRQVRYVGAAFRAILEHVLLTKTFSPRIAVDTVVTAILRLDPDGKILTSTHCMLANLAYTTGCLEYARPVMEKSILFFPEPNFKPKLLCDKSLPPCAYVTYATGLSSRLTSTNLLEYDLMRAMMYIQQREWAPALDALEQCISHPTDENAVSTIMLQAFYKWTLVSLLLYGRIIGFPGNPLPGAAAAFDSQGDPYITIDTLFAEENANGLKVHRDRHEARFITDSNLRLVDEVIASFQKWQIVGLGNLYYKISISEIRQLTQSAVTGRSLDTEAEVEDLIKTMITSKMLNATLEPSAFGRPAHLAFLPSPAPIPEAEYATQLEAAARSVAKVTADIEETNTALGRNREYLRYLQKEKKRREKEGDGPRDPAVDFETHIEDEDLMLGIGGTSA
ncbi:hypothetical protein jhhlp_006214 [Lomentospora prolificans]|uniref:COP9 signalosome complex subunit 3 n=1 Tax=Lomentospora prolificans TaxID=41688 RepID=A0A2N3N5A1_9PEZI|nr:hypothetical protein jhhlp_006214 [Lomentospora prolificans]